MDRPVLRPSQLFGLFCLSAFFVYLVLLFLIVLVSLLPSRHLFLIFALLSPLALCPYLRRRSSHRGRSQGTSSKDNLQGDQHDEEIPAYFIGSRHGFNTPESWAWGLPKQMGTPFTSSKDNLHGDQEFRDTPGNIKSCFEGLKQCSQALEELLSRGELTQSLSPPHQDGNWAINSGNEKALGLQIDLNTKVSTTTCNISKTRAQSCSKMGSEVATFKRLFVDTEEKNNTGQEGRQ